MRAAAIFSLAPLVLLFILSVAYLWLTWPGTTRFPDEM